MTDFMAADDTFAQALTHHLAGRLADALTGYAAVLTLSPDHVPALGNIAIVLMAQDRMAEAETFCRRVLAVRPGHTDAGVNLAITLYRQGRMAEAEASCRRTLAATPESAAAHNNLALVLLALDRPEDAESSCRRALSITPHFPDAHYNLGIALCDLGRLDEAEASYRAVLAANPGYAPAHNNLGVVLHKLGRLDEAAASCRCAIAARPDHGDAYNNLTFTLMALGRKEEAVETSLRALKLEDTWNSRNLFITGVERLAFTRDHPEIRAALVRAISEPWGRPSDLTATGAALVMVGHTADDDLAALADDALLRAILVSAPVAHVGLERLLTQARHALLAAAGKTRSGRTARLEFYCALARQCFINEYVFARTAKEAAQAQALRDRLAAALAAGQTIPALWLVAVAAYFPLHRLDGAPRLLERSWPAPVEAVLDLQIREPEAERHYRAAIPRLTAIEDEVSLSVQRQYEENPYPRWIKAAPANAPKPVDTVLRHSFPLADYRPLGKRDDLDVLIAGCGTGQHSVERARSFAGARILAVDLSLSSLAYAKRKSVELGLHEVDYAQADIMKLGSLDRRFDVIDSSGVLHHLADPLAGWRVLLGLLRPGGVMRLGLYSELARQDVVAARAFIAERGYTSSAEDISRCRQDLMAADAAPDLAPIVLSGDFFSTSACRDLIFHIQEHRMTLGGIDAFLVENNLRFLGFDLGGKALPAYGRRFPNDRAATNLRQWQIFESENPETFRGMYQFWVQK